MLHPTSVLEKPYPAVSAHGHAAAWNSYSDFYRESSYRRFPQEHRASKGKLPFRMIRVEQGSHSTIDPHVSETVIALPLTVGNACDISWRIDGVTHREVAEPGSMIVAPSETESSWEVNGNRTLLMLVLPNDTVRSVLGALCPKTIGPAFRRLSESAWSDSLVEVMMGRLWETAEGSEPVNSFLADGLVMSILSQMLIKAGSSLEANTSIVLPQWRLKRVKQYLEANISSEISMNDLAAAAGLSRRHFARSFHEEVGETPHRWLMQVRLEKAQEYLKASDKKISEIASLCGFASQSHFTTALKNATGMTPMRWRQHHR